MVPSARSWLSCHNNVAGKQAENRLARCWETQYYTLPICSHGNDKCNSVQCKCCTSCSFIINAVEKISYFVVFWLGDDLSRSLAKALSYFVVFLIRF